MKVLEMLVLAHLSLQVTSSLDLLQFAYCPEVDVEDAIIFLLEGAHSSGQRRQHCEDLIL